MMSTFMRSCGRVALVCSRTSFGSSAAQSVKSKFNSAVPLGRQSCVACCRQIQTTSSAHRGTPAAAVKADMDTEAGEYGVRFEELLQRLDSGKIKLIDVREPSEVEETGSMPASINIPITQLKSALELSDSEFLREFGILKPRRDDANVIFYDLSSVKGAAAAEIAHKLGFKWAQHYVGGWEEWSLNCRTQVD